MEGRVAIRGKFRFVFDRVQNIGAFHLLRRNRSKVGRKAFLVGVGVARVDPYGHPNHQFRFPWRRFSRNHFSTPVVSYSVGAITAPSLGVRE